MKLFQQQRSEKQMSLSLSSSLAESCMPAGRTSDLALTLLLSSVSFTKASTTATVYCTTVPRSSSDSGTLLRSSTDGTVVRSSSDGDSLPVALASSRTNRLRGARGTTRRGWGVSSSSTAPSTSGGGRKPDRRVTTCAELSGAESLVVPLALGVNSADSCNALAVAEVRLD